MTRLKTNFHELRNFKVCNIVFTYNCTQTMPKLLNIFDIYFIFVTKLKFFLLNGQFKAIFCVYICVKV